MDDARHDLHSFQNPANRRAVRVVERPSRFGKTLAEARQEKQLEPQDLAEITHIRLSHLEALEAGRFHELPEEPYSKNFVRLYAQAVGLDPARMLVMYAQERRLSSVQTQGKPIGLELPPERATPGMLEHPQLSRLLRMLVALLLVVLAVVLALRTFDRLLSFPRPVPVQTEPVQPGVPETTSAETTIPAPADTMILLSLRTTPPGAEISIDGYRFGQSPIVDAPVRAGERTVRVERGGYRTFERALDLSRNRRLNVELVPTELRGAATVTGAEPSPRRQTRRAAGQGTGPAASSVTITVTAEAWLEVYRGSARGEGERLVYQTAQPGATYTLSAPVYIFSGNAGGIFVAQGDAPARALGTSGAVVGQAY